MLKKLIIALVALGLIGIAAVVIIVKSVQSGLPQIITVKDYKPLLVSEVYDRNNQKIGEFARERRTLVPYNKIPKHVVQAFLAAEDDQFFEHKGINPQAIFRATLANLRAGQSVQGGSTITQQVAKTLLLTDEKTLTRKLSDILLALEMEKNLSKEDILFLYLNQIYFGQSAHGIEQAARIYFRKSVGDLNLQEAAMLAGLPKAPTAFSPVRNPKRSKERQLYVLRRMAEVGYVPKAEADKAGKEVLKVYVRENYQEFAPFYLESIRQILVEKLGESTVLDKGIRIYTGLDLKKQKAAQEAVLMGLKSLDKRQGYRGPEKNVTTEKEVAEFLLEQQKKLILESTPERLILPDGKFAEIAPPKNEDANKTLLPSYMKINDSILGVVSKVDDTLGLVTVLIPDGKGLIDFSSMTWARKPDTEVKSDSAIIRKPSEALKKGDIIHVKINAELFASDRLQNRKQAKGQPAPPR